jgi:hypothetical protein
MFLWWAIAFAIFLALGWKYFKEIINIGDFLKITVYHSQYCFIMTSSWLQYIPFLWTGKHIWGPCKILTISAGCSPWLCFTKIRIILKLEQWINRKQDFIQWTNRPIGNKEGRQIVWQRPPINIISPSMFHLNRVESGKDDSSSEAHLQSSKKVKAPI